MISPRCSPLQMRLWMRPVVLRNSHATWCSGSPRMVTGACRAVGLALWVRTGRQQASAGNWTGGAPDAVPVSPAQHEVHSATGFFLTNNAIRPCHGASKHVHPDSENLPGGLGGIRSGPGPDDSQFSSLRGVPAPQILRRHFAQRFVGNFDIHVAAQTGEKSSNDTFRSLVRPKSAAPGGTSAHRTLNPYRGIAYFARNCSALRRSCPTALSDFQRTFAVRPVGGFSSGCVYAGPENSEWSCLRWT